MTTDPSRQKPRDSGEDVASLLRESSASLLELTAKRRDTRASVAAALDTETALEKVAQAVRAVVAGLPAAGAVALQWPEALRLARLDQPSQACLLELQEQLRQANVLAAFGSRVVVFARDTQ